MQTPAPTLPPACFGRPFFVCYCTASHLLVSQLNKYVRMRARCGAESLTRTCAREKAAARELASIAAQEKERGFWRRDNDQELTGTVALETKYTRLRLDTLWDLPIYSADKVPLFGQNN